MKEEKRYLSQFGQDKFLDEKVFKSKKNGFFVDVGAFNGLELSNTFFFEKVREWSGICIEPSVASREIIKFRKNSKIVIACVSDEANKNEIVKLRQTNPLAISFTVFEDDEKYEHKNGEFMDKFQVCKTLDSILDDHALTSQEIDYISIDTEGCEYEVIKDFPFKKWNVSAFTVAHNVYLDTPEVVEKRKNIKKLLEKNNFVLFKEFSLKEMDKENWGKKFKDQILEDLYVNKSLIRENKLK